jgi:hypothetical protein
VTPEEIKKAIADGIAGALGGIEAKIAAIESKTAEALKPVGELATRLTAVEELATKPKPDGADKKADGKADPNAPDEIPAWAKDIVATIGEYKKRDETAAATAKVTALVDATLKAKAPNLKGPQLDALRAHAIAAGPADEAGVIAAINAKRQELAVFGVKVEPIGADPTKEGAQPNAPADPKAEQKQRIYELAKQAADPTASLIGAVKP